MNYSFLVFCFLMVVFVACTPETPDEIMNNIFPEFYKEGHRGTRGHMPENTIAAMKKAVDMEANILEMDVQISKDGEVVVAHDPYINSDFTLLDGQEIPTEDEKKYILHQMNYSDIRTFDVGSKPYAKFPQQNKIAVHMPLLGELIDSVEQYTKNLPGIIYNIEIKADPEQDGYYQPEPAMLIKKVMDVINKKDLGHRFYIQSFDVRQIREVHKSYPEVVTGFLTSDKKATFEENIAAIGYRPQIYSPHYKMATRELIDKCHEQKIKFVPWTVNTLEEMEKLKAMGVDGMITDYPNLFDQLE